MIISLSVFPIILLYVCSVKSVDNNKHDKDTQRYTVNHPPAVADYDTIPVTVLYDEYEVKEETSNTESELDKSDDTKEQHKVISIDSDELITKESLELKARSSSVGSRFTVANAEDSVLQKPVENKRNNRYRTQRKTLQQVRKTNVNNNETETKTNESTANKVAQKRSTTVKPFLQTSTQSPQSTTAKIQKRTGTRAPVVPIIESENYVYSHRGNFHYSYEGGDGTKAFERGELKKSENGSGLGEAVVGSYSYTDKDGNDFSLSYTADENGYRPVGAHLPTPPPIPPEIQAALRFLATKTTPEPVTEKVKKI